MPTDFSFEFDPSFVTLLDAQLENRTSGARARRLELGFGESSVTFELTLDTTMTGEAARVASTQGLSVPSVSVAGLTALTVAPRPGRLVDLGGTPANLAPLTIAGWPGTALQGVGDVNENLSGAVEGGAGGGGLLAIATTVGLLLCCCCWITAAAARRRRRKEKQNRAQIDPTKPQPDDTSCRRR